MTEDEFKDLNQKDLDEFNNKCEDCRQEHESVRQNLILTGFKLCKSCRVSKTIFPIQLKLLTGKASILLIMKAAERNAIIRKERKTTPKALKLDFKFSICLVEIIREAKIQNWVRNTIK